MLSRLSVAFWLLCLSISVSGNSQTPNPQQSSTDARATTKLGGHVPAFISRAEDLGQLDAGIPLTNVVLLLSHTSEQEQDLQGLLIDQQDPASPAYHHWLSPEEFGARFGARDVDIKTIISWLSSFGLQGKVSRSKTFIQVEGNASQASAAFKTEFHSFNLNGRVLYSVIDEPSLPAAILPFVKSISGLSQTVESPTLSPPSENSQIHPAETSNLGNHLIAPGDFATIFDIYPVYNAGYIGTGRTIAIIGRSRVNNADIENFGTYTGLTLVDPTVVLPPGSVDPGQTGDDDQREATLDVERASSVAPGATVNLVIDGNGLSGPLHYVIDNKAADIMTMSFGSCELNSSQSTVDTYSALFTQGAIEGITTFVSAGDSGVAGCDVHSMPAPATQLASINFYCASPNVTCVGGTQLNDTANPAMYWSPSNGKNRGSALSYIPEGAFNNPLTSSGSLQIFAGGGGPSMYIPKPSWQAGLNVPNDGFRDVPDIAFPSASHDNYLFCYALTGFPCTPNAQGVTALTGDGGTSAAAPSMAGIQALIDQAQGGPAGNINPRLYALAASMPNTIFHDVTVGSSGVTTCTLDVPSLCNNSTPSTNALTGGLAGYAVGPGYDLVTGWGSIDVYNLLTNWSSAPSLAPSTINLVLPESTITTKQSINFSASVSGNGPLPTGTVQFEVNGTAITPPAALSSGNATSSSFTSGTTQTDTVVAIYSGDAHYAPATSATLNLAVTLPATPIFTMSATPVTISAQGKTGTSTITVSAVNGFNGTVTLSCASFNGFESSSCSFSPATVNVNGNSATSTLSLVAALPSLRSANIAASGPQISPGGGLTSWEQPLLAMLFLGTLGIRRVRRTPTMRALAILALIVSIASGCGKANSTITVVSALNPATTQEPVALTATVVGSNPNSPPPGSVQFFANSVSIGPAQKLSNGVATLNQTFTTAGSFSITAEYLGSSSYGTVQSAPITETVVYKDAGAMPGSYTIVVQGSSGNLSQTVPVPVTLQ